MSAATHTLVRSPAWVVQPGALRRFAAVFVAGGFAGMIAGRGREQGRDAHRRPRGTRACPWGPGGSSTN